MLTFLIVSAMLVKDTSSRDHPIKERGSGLCIIGQINLVGRFHQPDDVITSDTSRNTICGTIHSNHQQKVPATYIIHHYSMSMISQTFES